MIAASARCGYRDASVARVVEHAGVSRATFYEHFKDKEDCFLTAYRQVAARVDGELERGRDARDRAREIVGGLLRGVDHDPAAARVVLIEALAGGDAVRAEHEGLLTQVEQSIDQYIGNATGVPRFEISARALMGGVSNVLAIRVFQGETGHLSDLLKSLLTWLHAYALPEDRPRRDRVDWARLGKTLGEASRPTEAAVDAPQIRLPRGRNALPSAVVAREQRDRLIAATAHIAYEKGYAAMTVADIVAAAGVAREAFYEHFRSKEDSFLAAQALALQESIAAVKGEFFCEAAWPERIWNGGAAMLGYIAGHADLACVQLVESFAAGAASIRRTYDSWMAYTLFLEDGYRQRPEAEQLPRLCSEAIAGANLEIFRQLAVGRETERWLELLPEVVYVSVAPFIGPERAIDFVEEKVSEAGTVRKARLAPSGRSSAHPAGA
jgi:AcrR family transcriptional regulator